MAEAGTVTASSSIGTLSEAIGDVVEWFQCPRRVYYSRFVGLKSEESTPLTLGNALHLTLQLFHNETGDFTKVVPGDDERWMIRLRELRKTVWSETEFDGAAIREACAIFADRILAGYARALQERSLATPFIVEASERDVEVSAGPLLLRGRIDRVDRRVGDGALLLIDYKSGSAQSRPFREYLGRATELWDAGNSLAGTIDHGFAAQLAFYASALQHVGEFAYVYLKGAKGARQSVSVDVTTYDEDTRRLVEQMIADVRSHLTEPLAENRLLTVSPAQNDRPCQLCNFKAICPGPAEDDV